MSEHFTAYQVTQNYKLLKPVQSHPRHVQLHDEALTLEQWQQYILRPASRSSIVALDFETTGLDPFSDSLVGVGLAWNSGVAYVNLRAQSPEVMAAVWERLVRLPLIAYNIMFDGRWLARLVGDHVVNWKGDAYGAFKHLATEGFDGQSWGLKDAQVSLLRWNTRGDEELNAWLVANGHVKATTKAADKSKMHLAPTEILGKYCGQDADSTYQLWTQVFAPVFKQFPAYARYHAQEYLTLLHLLIQQQNLGILMDVEHMTKYQKSLQETIERLRADFLTHPQVRKHIVKFKREEVAPLLQKVPQQFTKKGEVSKNYIKWVTKVLTTWVETTINIDSGLQLRKLFYEYVYDYDVTTDRRGNTTYVVDLGNGKTVHLEGTDSGLAPTDDDAVKWFGEPGKILCEYKDAVKQLSFIDKYFELMDANSCLHPGWRAPGTLTGRLSGAEPNVQQLSKHPDMLRCFRARPGYILVDSDFAALENVIGAELTRDENLLKLYGPKAKPNDGYLFWGAKLPVIGDRIRAAGYDPDNPTPEGIAAAKKEAKAERTITKVLVLSDQYGAGAEKKYKTLRSQGIDLSLEEVQDLHNTQQALQRGVLKYKQELLLEWERNGGYIVNAFGRPLTVADKLTKDLYSRACQSTGHDCTMRWIYHINRLVKERKLDANPFIVDLHDESIWEVREDQADAMVAVLQEACALLNNELKEAGWECLLKVEAARGPTLNEIKGG